MTEAELAEWQYEHQGELDAEAGELVEAEIAENLTVMISFRVTQQEANHIRGRAAATDLTVSDWIRQCCEAALDGLSQSDLAAPPEEESSDPRSVTLTVRLASSEAAAYRSEAALSGLSLSEWIRFACEADQSVENSTAMGLMAETVLFGFKESVGVELSLPHSADQAHGSSFGSIDLRIDGRTVWEGADFAPAGLLDYLARAWPALMWHDRPPLDLDPAPAPELRRQAHARAQSEPAQRGQGTVAAIERFIEQHDLSQGLIDASSVAPVVIVREGRYYWFCAEQVTERFSDRVVIDVLESVGNFMARMLAEALDDASTSARHRWENRLVVEAMERVMTATGLATEEVERLSGTQSVEEAWDLDATDPSELNELLAVARTASSLGERSLRVLLDAVRQQPRLKTDELDTISFRAQFELATHADKRPFEQGLLLAQWFRYEWTDTRDQALGRVNPDDVLSRWGVQVNELRGDLPSLFDAVSCWGPRRGPSVLINADGRHNESEGGRRATLAHELCHLLVDRTGALPFGEVLGMNRHSRAEARANAFAAELLIPQSVAGRVMSQAGDDPAAAVERLRGHFGASNEVISWQSRNSGVNLPEDVYSYLRGLVSQPDRF